MEYGSNLYNALFSYKKEFEADEIVGFHVVDQVSVTTP